ncbi:Minor extracellular protease vpr precursor [Cesiribacter andamanensis AMV16]|uniref:Minor extracellular protease vpr n=1 Tax=Cesiribacter andamanensis AMV16 TaxID=1279009 RepID=M7N7U9_9BACT|nr:Minor extracellular protease vpr precursor [Cesiribacter andamanensis AMV16]
MLFSTGGISLEPIPAKLVYLPMPDGSLALAWEVAIYTLDAQHYWVVQVDASTGKVLGEENRVVHCQFDNQGLDLEGKTMHALHKHAAAEQLLVGQLELPIPFAAEAEAMSTNTGSYRVFPMPIESPNHGSRSLLSGAADASASPQGWHYTPFGVDTRTRGNNVFAYEDPNNNGSFDNHSPDGGASLLFDYPLDLTQQPVAYRDAAITNLFYWNNITHDVWYQYGFDEAGGNFQYDNFGRGGKQNDPVLAEAQDSRNISATRNNANFLTRADGQTSRMQMYLWSGLPDQDLFRVTSPGAIAGSYPAIEAAFSKPLTPEAVTGSLVLLNDGLQNPEGCTAPTNAAELAGQIAVVYRGTCGFADKVQQAQIAGAIAVVVINNAPGAPITMGGAPTNPSPAITIPAVMISQESGQLIRAQLDAGVAVEIALKNDGSGPEVDGDFDNGIIVHEYGHGISIRLTGGPDNVGCLPSAYRYSDGVVRPTEQMGEGWSDWFALMMTMTKADTREKVRGIGTYASLQPTDGRGIRPAPYSTDFAVNNFTYGATNNEALSAPHGVGFVWATMLWDMTWDLIDQYGFDPDLYRGKGGNNMAMQLVIDGLKLQPCEPGFVNGRDAILLADRINYGGANQELIWKAFARRGLGANADQGLSRLRIDQTENFDLPAAYLCTEPLSITAVPTSEVYTGGVPTTLYLGYGPQSVTLQANGDATNQYSWSPATGLSDVTSANPVFTPTAEGSYTFTVQAVNADQCTKYATITIEVIDVRCGANNERIWVCHSGKGMCVDTPTDVAQHLAHGDQLGACGTGSEPVQVLTLDAMPNPFNTQTTIKFSMQLASNYTLELRNSNGTLVGIVAQGTSAAGQEHTVVLSRGSLKNGIYLLRLITDQEVATLRIMVSK